MNYLSSSSAETRNIGKRVAEVLLRAGVGRRARIVTLRGDLGSGKTTFVQGFARAIGARGRVQSPTFIIVRRMPIRRGAIGAGRTPRSFTGLYHIDAYRLQGARELRTLGFSDMLHDRAHVILVEWPERIPGLIPKGAVRVTLEHGSASHERRIEVAWPRLRRST